MDFIHAAVDLFLHLDRHLAEVIATYGVWTYLILFGVIFLETGIVATPFLPGDSLLFAAGTFAAMGSFDVGFLILLLSAAAILGDTVNYWIGRRLGPRVFRENVRFLNRQAGTAAGTPPPPAPPPAPRAASRRRRRRRRPRR